LLVEGPFSRRDGSLLIPSFAWLLAWATSFFLLLSMTDFPVLVMRVSALDTFYCNVSGQIDFFYEDFLLGGWGFSDRILDTEVYDG